MSATFASVRVPRLTWFREKTEVVPWSAWWSKEEIKATRKKLKRNGWALLPIPLTAASLLPSHTFAAGIGGEAIKSQIIHAFSPVVNLVQALSYPVSLIFLSMGMLLLSSGQRSKGVSSIKYAALGFIGMQFVPGIMEILIGVGDSIGAVGH